MDVTITPEPLLGADARALIAQLDAELADRYHDPEDIHIELADEEVAGGGGTFLVARLDGEPVGCAALRTLDPSTGEIKRVYVAPSARGARVGSRLLAELEGRAVRLGLERLVLETGPRQPEALRLYERAGFVRIPCFGEYAGASVCMGEELGGSRRA
ncbi:GNAT family N-acetyltransferase [Spirillospora sp. NBC_01491]|uniref:GNAT family N-acetyltransferase n=1 Tax=Spirillospora sp. NBC_01491 TaxID=2976007 RepID=UPI002E376CFC|nr:GNAT family N-acetyltransferase [Spirillospora sp. NBC_01491]